MNILDITNEDIARLQENKIVFGLLPERDMEIFGFIGTGNTDRYCSTGFYRCGENGIFQESAVYRIVSDYTLPTPTEAEIIKYLQASEVPPSQWPKAAQEWAKRHDENGIWEGKLTTGVWAKTVFVRSPVSGAWYSAPHRLRADYGKKDAGYVEFTDPPKSINPSDVSYGPFTLEPEVCVWEARRKDPPMWYITCSAQASFCKLGGYCPYCGKRIEIKQ